MYSRYQRHSSKIELLISTKEKKTTYFSKHKQKKIWFLTVHCKWYSKKKEILDLTYVGFFFQCGLDRAALLCSVDC